MEQPIWLAKWLWYTESIPYRRVLHGRVRLDERRLDEVQ